MNLRIKFSTRISATSVLSVVCGFCIVFPATMLAQPQVTATSPRQNEINVSPFAGIEVTFSQAINAGTLNSATWRVHGSQTGFYTGSIGYDSATRTARFTPSVSYKEGEIISAVLTSGVRNSSGQVLSPVFQFSFTVAVEFGTGVFDERIEISIGQDPDNPVERDPLAIFTGDFDGDQFLDLAVVNNATNSISILINRFFMLGGSFDVRDAIPAGNGPVSVTGADFDGDGALDLAVCNFDDNTISLLRNDGTGAFVVNQTIPTAEHPTYLEANDYNNDGQIDLAVVVLGVNRLQVFLNQGAGVFNSAPTGYATGASPYGFTSGDFDNDGDLDIVVTNSGDNSIMVFKNNGQAQFTVEGEINVPDFPTAVRTNDLIGRATGEYGDGVLDLVLVHPNLNAVSVLDNRSRDGGFVFSQLLDVGLRPEGVFVGDIDTMDATAFSSGFGRDHDLDLVVPSIFSNDVYVWRNQFNNGFTLDETDLYPAGEAPVSIVGGDFDRDGDIDLAVTNLTVNGVSILMNQGGQGGGLRFTEPTQVIDFGQVYVGTDSTRSFSVLNPTSEIITISEISTTLPVFTTSVPQANISPGEIFTLAITFAPTDTITYEDSLTIRTNAFGVPQSLRIPLRGEGIRAIISVVPDTLNFGGLLPPQTGTLPIEIFNGGNGALKISEFRFTDPAFTSSVDTLTVAAYSSEQVNITFTPAAAIAYFDTLSILNNDSLSSPLPVILMGGPNIFPPIITSADTVTAYEDSLFTYVATASDSDGTKPRFIFRDLPSWLNIASTNPANDAVTGTPREGDLDTTFTFIAVDGLLADTLDVYVRVIPINDFPVIAPIVDQTVVELDLLTFTLTASDPEDSTLAFTAQNLPPGAAFIDNGNRSGTFSWLAPAGSRGEYFVTFIVTEIFEAVPLSDTAVVKITVLEALPDLSVASLGVPTTDIAVNQTHPVTGIARADFAAVASPFRLTFMHNGATAVDTLITSMGFQEEISFTYNATFSRLGNHEIVFIVDSNDQIQESDESNNSAVLLLRATAPQLVVRPNPFTPNNDGFNDEAVFDFSELVLLQPELKIFNFKGALLATISGTVSSTFRWDGRDSSGRDQQPGIYLYVLSDSNDTVRSGYVVLAR